MTTLKPNDKAIRLVEYLLRLASLRSKLIRDLADYEQVLWLSDIPKEKGCYTPAWGRNDDYDEDVWIEVQGQKEPPLPSTPVICNDWIDESILRNKDSIPELQPQITKQYVNPHYKADSSNPEYLQQIELLTNHRQIETTWQRYLEEKWFPWVEEHNVWEKFHRVYSNLFAIYQNQLRLGEEYELILALGLLTWQTPTSQRAHRHLIVANASLEFEARIGRFTVRSNHDGAALRPELDMLDVDEQPTKAEEQAREGLIPANDDPWDKSCVEGVLKSLVHSIESRGEYRDILEAQRISASSKPIVEFAPALILRKRSAKGLMETLKSIKKQIEEGKTVPPEFADLSEISPPDKRFDSDGTDYAETNYDGEVYFPKPSNEEQRRIVHKIQYSSGVLVQGPPGTGKSHTIANLICHLLATGQRILVTAKTPRALQVLEGLLPEEIRPLCINLLGSGLEEKRSLETSVGGITSKHDEWNEIHANSEIARYEKELKDLRSEKIEVDRQIRSFRESETLPQTVSEGHFNGTAAQIAKQIQLQKHEFEWFTDSAPIKGAFLFTSQELLHILSILRRFNEDKQNELASIWPENLMTYFAFSDLVQREREAEDHMHQLEIGANRDFADCLSKTDEKTLTSLLSALEDFKKDLHDLIALPFPWIIDAIKDITCGKPSTWVEICRRTHDALLKTEKLISLAESTRLEFPLNTDIGQLYYDAQKLRSHFENGGKLGWGIFRPKVVKEVIHLTRTVRVNGQPCGNLNQITILIDLLQIRLELRKAWENWVGRYEEGNNSILLQIQALKDLANALDGVFSLENRKISCRKTLSKIRQIPEPSWNDAEQIGIVISSCKLAIARITVHRVKEEIRSLENSAASICARLDAHPISHQILTSIRTRDLDLYANCCEIIKMINESKNQIKKCNEDLKKLEKIVPNMKLAIQKTYEDRIWDERFGRIDDTWRWAQAKSWLEEYIRKEDSSSLGKRAKQLEDEIGTRISNIAALRAWRFCFDRLLDGHRRNMVAWQQSMQKLGKGTGKHAQKHRRDAQNHLNQCREAVPAWVMPLHRIWDTVEPAPQIFDLIIVDEASQCGFEALPLFYLCKKILIVGDNKQISPDAVGIDQNVVNRLMKDYINDFNFKTSFDVISSLFDHGKLRYGKRQIVLREHFRSMPEIIRFSNDLCYSTAPLIPLRQYGPDRLPPLEHRFIEGGFRKGSDNKVINELEAEAIADKIVELCQNPKYAGKSMGVVSLQGDSQAGLIQSILLDRLGVKEYQDRRLLCGNPYHFQGDERDIIFLSMVAAPNENIGPLTKPADERRFNVATSRARDQMWLFHSVTQNDLSKSCLRKRLLEFFETTQPHKISGIDNDDLEKRAYQDNRSIIKPPQPFESWFEVDVALEIARRKFLVIPQYPVAQKRIDLVIEGGIARLAVECDGDTWHGVDQYEADCERERMLTRKGIGWEFCHIRESAFYADKDGALKRLWQMLEERGIYPTKPDPIIVEPSQLEVKAPDAIIENLTKSEVIQIGSMVTYVNENNGKEFEVTITNGVGKPEWGTINANTPIARALLGHSIGEIVIAKPPTGELQLKIVKFS